ncbi:TIGR04372 family glycosyltransferase [Candidatus Thioglobus sp.]|nr:TIGR04372 family glycosyltransferase [Candidatus Thioglobus sp.]
MLDIGRIGGLYHAEKYLSEKQCGGHQGQYLDRFYFVKATTKHVNQQWIKMWERKLNVLFFSKLAQSIERVNKLLPGYEKYQIPNSTLVPSREEYQNYISGKNPTMYSKYNKCIESVLSVNQPNLSFISEEVMLGDKYLQKIGIPLNSSFICFHNRDSAFLDSVESDFVWSYHNYRDSNIQNYLNAVEAIILRGNYAVRMGAITKDKLQNTNPKLIDYANNGMRTDFLDIYLSSKCKFILCSDTGMSFPAEVFKRPLVYVNWTMFLSLPVYTLNGLIIFKKFYLKNENRFMTFLEIINLDFGGFHTNEVFSDLGLELIENTPEEILAVTIEMDERLNGTWENTKEDKELQESFWDLFGPEKLKSPNLLIGADYLRNNNDLLN